MRQKGNKMMDRFLLAFGLLVFVTSLIFMVMNFIGEYDGQGFIVSVFGMLNASIAICVSEILRKVISIGQA